MDVSLNSESGIRVMGEEDLGSNGYSSVIPPREFGGEPYHSTVGFPPKRLLVVDDQEDMHLMLGDRFEAMGYEIVSATNGMKALYVLAQCPVGGILLDLEMPVMDGLTLLQELRRQQIQVPVIVMSATDNPQKFMQAMELGAVDYLCKPLDAVLLTQKCRRIFV